MAQRGRGRTKDHNHKRRRPLEVCEPTHCKIECQCCIDSTRRLRYGLNDIWSRNDSTELLWFHVMDVCRSLTCDQTYPYVTLISKALK